MNRTRIILTGGTFLATFAWLGGPDPNQSLAALWPSVLAVGLAFLTRQIYLSLFLGAWAGAILLRHGDFGRAFLDLFEKHLLPSLADPWNAGILVFTLMMGGFVEILNRNGGMAAIAARVMGRARDPKRAGLGAYLMGWLIFFDGLANSMLVGKTMLPMADRAGLSRAKLAFIVDSTSSPIAGLALISTWIAYELSVIRQGLELANDPAWATSVAPYALFVESLPYRFYNYFLLWLVLLTVVMGRDWGPMRTSERQARRSLRTFNPTNSESRAHPGRIWLAVIPLAVLVAGVFGGLFVHGGGWQRPWTLANIIQAFGDANAALVLVWATALASMVALLLSAFFARDPDHGGWDAFLDGMKQMFLPALILVFAWTLNGVIKEMGTASYLVTLLDSRVPVSVMPFLVFLLSSLISFSTGTSWGTMALVMPLVIPVVVQTGGFEAGTTADPVLLATIGAVLAGAVFGDHCSPISDTTIVSAFSCECDVMEHVRTQLPYALVAAGAATVIGYAPAGWGWSPIALLITGGLAIWALVRYVGKVSHED